MGAKPSSDGIGSSTFRAEQSPDFGPGTVGQRFQLWSICLLAEVQFFENYKAPAPLFILNYLPVTELEPGTEF